MKITAMITTRQATESNWHPVQDASYDHSYVLIIAAKPKKCDGYEAMAFRDPISNPFHTNHVNGVSSVVTHNISKDFPGRWVIEVVASQPTELEIENYWVKRCNSLTEARHVLESMLETSYIWLGGSLPKRSRRRVVTHVKC